MQLDDETLAKYLNDHLAGSVAALKLMGRICEAHADGPLGMLMTRLRSDIEYEQTQLRLLLTALGAAESHAAQAFAWLSEKLTRLKIGAGERDGSGIELFEALEALSMGFFGRMSLWRILAVVRDELPLNIDVDSLATRASRHLGDLEDARLAAGLAALSGAPHEVAISH